MFLKYINLFSSSPSLISHQHKSLFTCLFFFSYSIQLRYFITFVYPSVIKTKQNSIYFHRRVIIKTFIFLTSFKILLPFLAYIQHSPQETFVFFPTFFISTIFLPSYQPSTVMKKKKEKVPNLSFHLHGFSPHIGSKNTPGKLPVRTCQLHHSPSFPRISHSHQKPTSLYFFIPS